MATGQEANFTITGTDKTKKVLQGTQKNLKNTSKEANTLASRFRNMARATAAIEGPLGGTAGRMSVIATLMGNMNLGVLAVTAAFTGLTAITVASLKAFADYESQVLKINQLLEQTDFAAGKTAENIEDMAQRIGFATLESTQEVRDASGVLLSFKSIAGDAFKRTMVLAADMTAVVGGDLNSAVKQLGKALEDPATGMSALRRSGVSFTNSQKDMIVAMKEAGDVAGAQNEILKILEGQLGGAGAAAGGGLAGAADAVGESWTLMLEQFAKGGAGAAATDMLNSLARALQYVDFLSSGMADKEATAIRMTIENNKLRKEIAEQESSSAFKLIRLGETEINKKKEQIRLNNEAMASMRLSTEMAEKLAKKKSEIAQKEINAESRRSQDKAALDKIDNDKEMSEWEKHLAKKREKDEQSVQDELDADARRLMNHREHLIKIGEDDKKYAEAKKQREEMERNAAIGATQGALGDIAGLMNSENKKLFKIGKAAAISNAIISSSLAILKTMEYVPYPLNIPLAALQGVAGMAQVSNIKKQQYSGAREFGGPVISGRTYLVGEKGPEAFTAPTSGNITTNKNITNNNASGERTVNLTMVAASDAQMDDWANRNRSLLFNTVVEAMNEEGRGFTR